MTQSASQVVRGIAAILVLAAGSTSAGAQVLEAPQRTRVLRGRAAPDPNAARHELTMQLNILGGYDDHLVADNVAQPGAANPFAPGESGYLGFTDAAVRYWVGRRDRSLEIRGGGFMHSYRNLGVTPSYGATASASGRITFARQNQFAASQMVRWDPFVMLARLTPGFDATAAATNPNAFNALAERRSQTSATTATLTHSWTRQTSTAVAYTFNQHTALSGPASEGRKHIGLVTLTKQLGRTSGLNASYRHSDAEFTNFGFVHPTVDRTLDAGFYYDRGISPTRRLALSGGGGALNIDTISSFTRRPLTYTTPSAYGSLHVDIGRTWGVGGDYRRGVSVLQGTGVDSFVVHNAGISTGGLLSDRLETVFSVQYSNGRTAPLALGAAGAYDGYTGAVQVRVTLTEWWSAIANLNHYEFRMNSIASASVGVPPQLARNSVRIGLTWAVPLHASRSPRTPRPTGGRN